MEYILMKRITVVLNLYGSILSLCSASNMDGVLAEHYPISRRY